MVRIGPDQRHRDGGALPQILMIDLGDARQERLAEHRGERRHRVPLLLERTSLRDVQLEPLALPAELLEALREARRLRGRSALARQHQYIGRLMRELDPEPIERALDMAAGRGAARGKMPR